MLTTILIGLSYLATLTVGLAGGAFLARHDLRQQLRRTVSAAIDAEEQRLADAYDAEPPADAWTLDVLACEENAEILGTPLHDYYRKEDQC